MVKKSKNFSAYFTSIICFNLNHIYEGEKKDVVSRSNLFHISSDNFTKEAEIIRLLSDKANEKTEENKKMVVKKLVE